MKAKNISKRILEGTLGVFSTAVDLILFTFLMLEEVALNPADAYSMLKLQRRLGRLFLTGKDRIFSNALHNARSKGWLEKDWRLTKEGRERLKNILPIFLPPRHWNKNWYLVIFDVPEKMRRKRDILRENLKTLGFGQLQASVWITPINYLENVEEIIQHYNLEQYVIFSETNKIGREISQLLAENIWRLKKINKEYENFISEWSKNNKSRKFWLICKYFSILKKDPQLPRELLPENWLGDRAYELIKDDLKKFERI